MTATRLRKREEEVLAFLACHAEGVRSQQLADALGITYPYASLILSTLNKLARCRRLSRGVYGPLRAEVKSPPACDAPAPPPDIPVTGLDRLIANVDEIHTRLDRIVTTGPLAIDGHPAMTSLALALAHVERAQRAFDHPETQVDRPMSFRTDKSRLHPLRS